MGGIDVKDWKFEVWLVEQGYVELGGDAIVE